MCMGGDEMRRGTRCSETLARMLATRGPAMMLILAAVLAVALIGATSAGAAELPDKDPFYKAPQPGEAHENWREEAPGTVLKKRALNLFGYNADQLLFRSSNTHGEPIVAVTT